MKAGAQWLFTRGFTLDFTFGVGHAASGALTCAADGGQTERPAGSQDSLGRPRHFDGYAATNWPFPRSSSSLWGSPQAVLSHTGHYVMSRSAGCSLPCCGGTAYVQSQVIVDGLDEVLAGAEVAFGRLNRSVAQQQLDLL